MNKRLFAGAVLLLVTATFANASTLSFDFKSGGGTILDANGIGTNFTTHLPGTGANLAANDTSLLMNTGAGTLSITTRVADFNGQVNMGDASVPGIMLGSLGFSGTQDFSATIVFSATQNPMPDSLEQFGLIIGTSSNSNTRAGSIAIFNDNQRYSANNTGNDATTFGTSLGADGFAPLTITISRTSGTWSWVINGVSTPAPAQPTFLNSATDLFVGVYGIDPFVLADGSTDKLSSFSVTVVPEPSTITLLLVSSFGLLAFRGCMRRA